MAIEAEIGEEGVAGRVRVCADDVADETLLPVDGDMGQIGKALEEAAEPALAERCARGFVGKALGEARLEEDRVELGCAMLPAGERGEPLDADLRGDALVTVRGQGISPCMLAGR